MFAVLSILDINLTFLTAMLSLYEVFRNVDPVTFVFFFFVFSYLMNTEVEKLNLRAFDGHQDVKTYM